MKLQNLSTRAFLRLIVGGASLTSILFLFILYAFTKDIRMILGGFSVMILLFFWGAVFLHYFQKKLSVFTDGLCRTLDEMMDSTVRPQINYEAETLLARISHRLERLYHVMQETRLKVEEEKAELQSLVSDISHQTKTPIANLKMLNDTMLTRRITDETRKEFLHATASQLDKLDFLIQGMVKTSRLETGVITLEKKESDIADTLVDAINGVLAPMERKHLHLSVNCPENLTVLHDSRWTSEALFNLLDNAVKYTPEGGDIHVAVQDWEMYLEIAVTDTGETYPDIDKCDKLAKYYGVTIDSLVHQDNKVDDIKIAPAPIGKHLWGTVTIGSKGQIVIPKAARETFKLNEGDRLVVLGDDAEGIALVKVDVFEQRVQEALKLSRQMTNE